MLKYKEIFLGGPCNNNCLYCPSPHKVLPQLPAADVDSLLTRGDEDSVSFYGGEPTLRGDLFHLIRSAVERGYRRVRISTNGRMLSNPNYLAQLASSGCRLFEIKLWGSNPDLHDYLTRAPHSFMETMQGLHNVSELELQKFLAAVIPLCRENYQDLENIVATTLNFGVHRIVVRLEDPALSLSAALPHIMNAVNISIFNRTWLIIEGIPICLLKGFEPHVAEIYSKWESIYEKSFVRHRYCVDCVYRTLCPGVEERHFRTFGEKEFAVVSAGDHASAIKALYE